MSALLRRALEPVTERSPVSDQCYRFYDIDHDGRITGASNRPFADDAAALAHADQLLMNWPAIEVWQTDRLVGRVEHSQVA
jgi:hypothetical protein